MNAHTIFKQAASILGIVSLAVVCGLISGCSGSSPSATSTSAATSSTVSDTEASSTVSTASNTAAGTATLDTSAYDLEYSKRDTQTDYDAASAIAVSLADNASQADSAGVTVDGNEITISAEGTYVLKGSLSDGHIVVAAPDDAKVQVVLDGVTLTCNSGPCIRVDSGDKVFITLAENSSNTLSDGSGFVCTDVEDEANATIYSTSDLTINGTGSLTINSTAKHGINSKDDLVITGGTFNITAPVDTLRGKDCVKILDGTFTLNAGQDGVKSSNADEDGRGFVSIDGASITITAGDDGIQAAKLVRIAGGTQNITSGDDAVHSDTDALLGGGSLNINAGDDAVHAEFTLDVTAGTITIDSCYEGLEGQDIIIEGGSTVLTADDDGVNATKGSTASEDETATTNERAMGQGPMTGMQEGGFDASGTLTITDGLLVVNAPTGDGLDSNGSISMSGGTVLICGPQSNDNGALDYDTDATITGGTFMALSSNGMAQSFGSDSTQASVVTTQSGNAGDLVSVVDADGTVVVSLTARYAYGLIEASAPSIASGTDYSIVIGGTNSAADSYGLATSGTIEGGTDAGTVTASTEAATTSMGMGGMRGGGGPTGNIDPAQKGMGGMRGGDQAPTDAGAAQPTDAAPTDAAQV